MHRVYLIYFPSSRGHCSFCLIHNVMGDFVSYILFVLVVIVCSRINMVSAISYWSKIQVEDLDSIPPLFPYLFQLTSLESFHIPRCGMKGLCGNAFGL